MRILHLGMHFNPLLGGGNLRNSEIIKHCMQEFNDEIHIISKVEPGFEQKLPEYLKTSEDFKGVHCYFHNSSFDQVREAVKLSRKIKFDVVHFHNQRVAFMGSYFFGGQKQVLELHALLHLDKWKDWLFRRVVRRIEHFIVLGEQGKKMLCEMYKGIDDRQVTVVRNGINPINDLQQGKQILDPAYFWIAYIGTFFVWQGVYNFLESCQLFIRQYPDLPVRFIMIGGGPCFEDIKGIIGKLPEGTRERILLTGTVPPSEVPQYWREVDVTVLPRPSTNETESTEPLKLQEAVNYGKLIVGTDVGGFRSLLTHGYNALLSVPGNNQELANNYYKIYNDRSLQEMLKKNVLETKRQLTTWKEAVKKIKTVYAS